MHDPQFRSVLLFENVFTLERKFTMRQAILRNTLILQLLLISIPSYGAPVDLFETIGWEDEAALKKAIQSGGNVNQIDPSQEVTILMKAIETMKPNLVKLLLDAKANVNLKLPETEKTALMHFMQKYIMNSETEADETRYTDDDAMISIFNLLLQAGAKVNDIDREGKSVLSYAIDSSYASQSETILSKLISLKADPNGLFSKDNPKPICLLSAEDTSGSHRLAFKLFLKSRLCDPNKVYSERNQRKTTLLYIAANQKDMEGVKILLEAGANPNKGASDTMMDYLPIFPIVSDIKILELMLKYKADPNSIENNIHLLEHAARNIADDESGEKVIDLLLKYGCDINHPKLFDTYTPYNKAVYAAHIVGKYRIEKYLEKKGAVTSNKLNLKKPSRF